MENNYSAKFRNGEMRQSLLKAEYSVNMSSPQKKLESYPKDKREEDFREADKNLVEQESRMIGILSRLEMIPVDY